MVLRSPAAASQVSPDEHNAQSSSVEGKEQHSACWNKRDYRTSLTPRFNSSASVSSSSSSRYSKSDSLSSLIDFLLEGGLCLTFAFS